MDGIFVVATEGTERRVNYLEKMEQTFCWDGSGDVSIYYIAVNEIQR
jgi:hypothetical protein